jgi:hypothetical protein
VAAIGLALVEARPCAHPQRDFPNNWWRRKLMLKFIELFTHSAELHKTFRTALIVAAVYFVAHGLFAAVNPPPTIVTAPTAVPAATAHPVAHEAQAAVDASRTVANVRGGQVPGYAQAAVRVVHDCFMGFSAAQCFAIMQGTRPKTAPVINVTAKLSGPTPAPTPTPGVFSKEQIDTMFAVAKSADAAVMAQSHIDVNAKLDYAEVPTSKLGALLTPAGSGIGYDIAQRKQFLLVAGAIERGNHVSPVLALHWKIKHTSLSCGPAVYYDQRLRPQASCATYF